MPTFEEDRERYQLYLQSREWSELRNAVRQRCGGICERCGINRMQSTHHLTYARKYCELLTDLQGICSPCHEFIHGHANFDPAAPRAILLDGTEVKTVYLAGKCRDTHYTEDDQEVETGMQGADWRSLITDAYFIGHKQAILDRVSLVEEDAIKIGGAKVGYSGPYIHYDHGCYTVAKHGDDNGYDNVGTLERSCRGVALADLVFAWIDSPDCYGTLSEVGFAFAHEKKIRIAGPKRFDEMWFIYAMADEPARFDCPNAGEAFRRLFRSQRQQVA